MSVPAASVYKTQRANVQSLFRQAYYAEADALFWDLICSQNPGFFVEQRLGEVSGCDEQRNYRLSIDNDLLLMKKMDLFAHCMPFMHYASSRLESSVPFWRKSFPYVSVIIGSSTNAQLLSDILAAVAHQRYPSNRFEIIVVDQRASDGARDVVELFAVKFPIRITYTRETNCGLSDCLSTGIRFARGDIVAYITDDSDVGPDWLPGMIAAYESPEVCCASGRIRPVWLSGRPEWLPEQWLNCFSRPEHPDARLADEVRWPDFPWGVNLSFRKNLFDRVGMIPQEPDFKEDGHSTDHGDHLYKWLLSQRVRIAFAEDAVLVCKMRVEHLPRQYFYHRMYRAGRLQALVDAHSGVDQYHSICAHLANYLNARGQKVYTRCLQRMIIGYLYQKMYADQQIRGKNNKVEYRVLLDYLADRARSNHGRNVQYKPPSPATVPINKPLLRIALADYWHEMVPDELLRSDPFFVLLSRHFELVMSDDPDILFFSVFGGKHRTYTCLKVCYTGENRISFPWEYDYSFSFSATDRINFFYPFFARDPYFHQFKQQCYNPELQALRNSPKTHFCAFIHSNSYAATRIDFCTALMRYKHVDCPGEVLNNMARIGSSLDEKLTFLADRKFTIAFENESSPDYTTEKILHAFLVGSIPIYWGNPAVAAWFNPKSFVNCHEYRNFDEVIGRIIEIDTNDQLYHSYRTARPFLEGSKVDQISEEDLEKRLVLIARKALAQRLSRSADALSLSTDNQNSIHAAVLEEHGPNMHLLTFGDSVHYHHALRRCADQAERMLDQAGNRVFRTINCIDDRFLADKCQDFWKAHQQFIQSNRRGYGYWIWKPYLIRKMMDHSEENSVICYMDAGCELNRGGLGRLLEYYRLSLQYGGVCFSLEHPDLEYTKMDAYQRIMGKCSNDLKELQIAGGVLFIKNDLANRAFVDRWYAACSENDYHYIDDSASILPNHAAFKEHRHDQSIFSLLVKKYRMFCVLKDETYWASSGWQGQATSYPVWALRNRSATAVCT